MIDPVRSQLIHARGRLIATAALLLLQSVVMVAAPWPLKLIFDTLMRDEAGPLGFWIASKVTTPFTPLSLEIVANGGMFLILALVAASLAFREQNSTARLALDIVNRLRRDLLAQLLHGRLSYIETHPPSELAERVTGDTFALEAVLVSGLRSVARAVPSLILLLATLYVLDHRLSAIFLVLVIPIYMLASALGRRSRIHGRRAAQESLHFRDEIERTLRRLPGVKSLASESSALSALDSRSLSAIEHEADSRRAIAILGSSMLSMKVAMRALVAVVGGFSVVNGELTLGSLALIFAYIENVDDAVLEVGRFMSQARTVSPALERVRELANALDEAEETEGSKKTSSLPFPDADTVHFEHVALTPNLAPISADFAPGELIALVGGAGVGKSLFGRALNRLCDPASGRIVIGRTDLKRYQLQLLRSTVTVVDRTPFFLRASVRDNLLLSVGSDIDGQSMNEALHAAAVDFIADLPEKLETIIGEGAYTLRSDQEARLHIARAFLRSESRVFFFDEPTADLDPEEARTIFESLHLLTERGAIVFWVTRRLDEVAESDRVIFFPNAKDSAPRIEPHDRLMATDEAYRRLFGLRERQARSSGEKDAAGARLEDGVHPEV